MSVKFKPGSRVDSSLDEEPARKSWSATGAQVDAELVLQLRRECSRSLIDELNVSSQPIRDRLDWWAISREGYGAQGEMFGPEGNARYPFTPHMLEGDRWIPSYEATLFVLLGKAEGGYPEAEEELCDRVGTLRRMFPIHISDMPKRLQTLVRKSVSYFRTQTNREVDFESEDPRQWITAHWGKPRW